MAKKTKGNLSKAIRETKAFKEWKNKLNKNKMETKTQLTAVEWFNQQLVDRQNGNGDSRSRDEIFEQAKEMEKEQIIKAVYHTCSAMSHSDIPCGEQYYNETFKSE